MRVGIAGYGVVGKKRYSSIIKNTSFKVTDISELNPNARDEIPDGINVFNNYQDPILKADLDIIFISLPCFFDSFTFNINIKFFIFLWHTFEGIIGKYFFRKV